MSWKQTSLRKHRSCTNSSRALLLMLLAISPVHRLKQMAHSETGLALNSLNSSHIYMYCMCREPRSASLLTPLTCNSMITRLINSYWLFTPYNLLNGRSLHSVPEIITVDVRFIYTYNLDWPCLVAFFLLILNQSICRCLVQIWMCLNFEILRKFLRILIIR